MKIDLHTHTYYSDGIYKPLDLIKEATNKKIGIISITDHNNVNGVKEILTTKDPLPENIKIIPGVELTAQHPRGHMHILGYDINPKSRAMNEILNEYKTQNIYYTMELLTLLKNNRHNPSLTFKDKDIRKLLNNKRNAGKNTLAELLVEYNYADNFLDAMSHLNYLKTHMNSTGKKEKGISALNCIETIKKAGGIPVLAHPITLKTTSNAELDATIKRLVHYGLEGIEVYTPKHKRIDREKYLLLAEKYNLLVSGGSDFHGTAMKEEKLGYLGNKPGPKTEDITLLKRLSL